jgi:excisionase family DNA binding protein
MLLATKQAAQRLGVHPATVRRWTASGRLRYVRIGRERAIPAEEIARMRRDRRRKGKARAHRP